MLIVLKRIKENLIQENMLRIEQTSKCFRNGFLALNEINLQVKPGEIVSLIGTSGCGKSTLLRLIAGLDFPTSGQIWIDDEQVTAPHPKISLIFQESRLMPWLTVEQNIRFGLTGLSLANQIHQAGMMLDRMGLQGFAKALPRQLSGGMAQRVAIARALVTQPSILLLDEPFSALDAFIRMRLQDHLLQVWHYEQPTLILVTHDIEEALFLSDRVIVLRAHPGRIHQEFILDLPRPRDRVSLEFQCWKAKLLQTLDFSTEPLDCIQV